MVHSLRPNFDRDLNTIFDELLAMSQLVDQSLDRAMTAMRQRDNSMAAGVIADDVHVNEMRYKIEEVCLKIIATQQPMAGDLRAIIAVMHSVVELERMADHAAGIAKIVIRSSDEAPLKPMKKLLRMAELSRQMLADCMQAFVKRDEDAARQIAAQDATIDRLNKSIIERLIQAMTKHPRIAPTATYMMWTAHNLERIADRVTNLAEQVVFMTTGDYRELDN